MTEEHASKRNPVWMRDELLLALELYLKYRSTSLPNASSKEVLDLSSLLNQLGALLGNSKKNSTYRNANAVHMKLMNFCRCDPLNVQKGKKGLTRGSKEELVVWDEFANDIEKLSFVCQSIRQAISSASCLDDYTHDLDILEAPEGRILTYLHRKRERSPKLIARAKQNAMKKEGRLFCTVCKFDFAKVYGKAGEGIIDVHHTKPLHTLDENGKTNVNDLVLLCSNCHRVVHSKRKWFSIAEVSAFIKNQKEA